MTRSVGDGHATADAAIADTREEASWMRPQRSPDCTHPAEWCDRCTLTTSSLNLLRTVDGTERQLCVNRRHSHGIWAYKDRCLRPGSPYPAAHRLTGAAALAALVALGAAAATAVRFARWLTG